MQTRLANIRKEVHRKCAHYIATTFDVILLPEFGSKRMVNKHTRKMSTDTVHRLLLWAHYKFRKHMIARAKENGNVLLIVNEAYTTKRVAGAAGSSTSLEKGNALYAGRVG
jgi:IS605 OrfB family transposase